MPELRYAFAELPYRGSDVFNPFGHDWINRPLVELNMTSESYSASAFGLLDTGALRTLASSYIADDLGINVESCPHAAVVIGGGTREARFSWVSATLRDPLGASLDVRLWVGFVDGDFDRDFDIKHLDTVPKTCTFSFCKFCNIRNRTIKYVACRVECNNNFLF